MRLEINNKKNSEEIKYLETNENEKHINSKPIEYHKSNSKNVYNDTIFPQETRNISNKQPKLTPKTTRERTTTKTKVNRRKEIIKIKAKKNEIETKKTIVKINENKRWFFETQRDGIGRDVGGGYRIGNTYAPVVDSC